MKRNVQHKDEAVAAQKLAIDYGSFGVLQHTVGSLVSRGQQTADDDGELGIAWQKLTGCWEK